MRKINFSTINYLGLGLILLALNSSAWGNKISKCSAYSQNSVQDQIKNIKSNCGFKGKHWSPSLREHQSWCLKNKTSLVENKTTIRHQLLEQCGRVMQRDLEWSELGFDIQNQLFGQLIKAVAVDDISSLRLFESQGVDLNFEWHLIDGGLLYWAISNQAPQVVRYLIEEKSANPNLTANGGPNPLVKLLNNAPLVNYRLLEYLLRSGARPNHGGEDFSDNNFPITMAAMNNDLQAVQLLLKYKADPNLYESVPPLMIAIYHNNSRMVDVLLKYGANQNKGLNGLDCNGVRKSQYTGDLLPMDAAVLANNSRIINSLSRMSAKTTAQCLSGS